VAIAAEGTVVDREPQPVPARPGSQEPKGWLATITVGIVTIGIVGLGFLVSRASLGLPVLPVDIGRGVRIYPPVEWQFVGPLRDGTGGKFANGQGAVIVEVDSQRDEQAVATGVRDSLVSGGASATEVESAPDAHGPNRAATFAFNGTFSGVQTVVEGEVFVVAGTNDSVVFIAIAGPGRYNAIEDAAAAMIRSATIP
jgi:hypothetical protein